MIDFLSAYGRPSDRLNAIKGLLGGYTGESSVLSQMGDYLNSSLGLGNIKSITPVQGSQGTTYMVTSNDGQQYAMTAPGTRQGDGAYVARPENTSAGKVSYGESFGGGADNQGAAMDASPTFAGGWQNTLDNPIYLSKYTEGMAMPDVKFDPTAYKEDSLLQGIAPYLAVAAPAIIGALAPSLMPGYTGTASELAADGLGGVDMFGGTMGMHSGYTGTAAELAADGLGGVDMSGLTQPPAPVVDGQLSWLKPGTAMNLNGTNYFGLPGGSPMSIGTGTADDWLVKAINGVSKLAGGGSGLLEKSLGLLTQGQQPTGGLLGGGGGGYSRGNSPYSANPVAYQRAQYAKLFGE